MKRFAILVLVGFVSVSLASAQAPEVEWEGTSGGAKDDVGFSVQQTSDGGFVITGYTETEYNACLIKVDSQGNKVWEKTFGEQGNDYGLSVQQTTDGGFIVAGCTRSFGAGESDTYLVKTDPSGDLVWQQTFGGAKNDRGQSVQQTSDGGFVVAGDTASFGAGNRDVYLVKTDALGNEVWAKTFGGSGEEQGYYVQQTGDGGFIVAGRTASFGAGQEDVYLIRTDAQGNEVWAKTFGGTNYDYGFSVQQTTDGGFIVSGGTHSFGAGQEDVYLVKTDAQGNEVWTKTFGGTNYEFGYSVQQTTDGGFIVSGGTRSTGAGDYDVYLIKTDAQGNEVWAKTFGGTSEDFSLSVRQTSEGGYIVVGSAQSFGAGSRDVYFIKLKSETPSFPDCNRNGLDDAIDISSGASQDRNKNEIPDECEPSFIRGNTNQDGKVNIADPIAAVTWLLLDANFPICHDAADADDSGEVRINDVVYVLTFLFLGGPDPEPPYPDRGPDPTPDELGCDLAPR